MVVESLEKDSREKIPADYKNRISNKINRIYTNPINPGSFSGLENLYEQVRKKYPGITKNDVRQFLEGNRTYTLFKPRLIKYKRSKFVPAGFLTDLQVDLGDFQTLAKKNSGFRYLLVAVDVLSRRVFTSPVRSKTGLEMKNSFEKLFSQMPYLPQQIFSDRGMEFESKEMLGYYKDKGIEKFKARASEIKAGVAERMIKTIKQRLYRYFSEKNTTNWIDVLPKITDAINNSVCRITGKRPIDINPENASSIWEKVYGTYVRGVATNSKKKTKSNKFLPGDKVRISRAKPIFEKGYLPTFSDEIFTVNSKSRANPDHFQLKDYKEEPIHGRFYAPELLKVRVDEETTYRIEKVLKKRTKKGKKEMLVKFIGYPENYWILSSDIVN